MSPVHRFLTLISLTLLFAGVWTGPVNAQPLADAPVGVEVWRTEVPRAVVPDRTPAVPAPTASSARLLPDRHDRTDGRSAAVLSAPVGRLAAAEFRGACAPLSGDTRLYDVLRVYRL